MAFALPCVAVPAPADAARPLNASSATRLLDRYGAPLADDCAFGPAARGGLAMNGAAELRATVDRRKQQLMRDALEGRPGAAVVLDARSGEVLAMASYPLCEKLNFSTNLALSVAEMVRSARSTPAFNRCVLQAYPLGSMIRPLVLAAAATNLSFVCRGEADGARLSCAGQGHGPVNADRALQVGCLGFFGAMAHAAGAPRILRVAAEAGLGRPTGLEVNAESGGALPGAAPASRSDSGPQDPAGAEALCAGSAPITATPLQMAVLAAAIANGGTLLKPRLVYAARPEADTSNAGSRLTWPTGVLHVVRNAASVSRARSRSGVDCSDTQWASMAGSASSTDEGRAVSYAWLLGWAPAANPRYALAAVSRQIDPGGTLAGRLGEGVREMLESDTWAWSEPPWDAAATDRIDLRVRPTAGSDVRWRLVHLLATSGTIARAEERVEAYGHVRIETEAQEGQEVRVMLSDADVSSIDPSIRLFGFRRSRVLGKAIVTRSLELRQAAGLLDGLALLALPSAPQPVNGQWTSPFLPRVARELDVPVASGTNVCRLAGVAAVNGRRLARIEFRGRAELSVEKAGIRKLLGIRGGQWKPDEPPGARVEAVLPDYPAEQNGIQVGDLIVRIGDDPIDSWPDLVAAVAVRPYGQPLNVTLTRRGERKEFTLVPRTSENGDVRSEVNIQGALVLDLTASMPTRLVIDSMSVRNVIRKDGNVLAESVRCSSVLQFVPCGDVQATGAAR